MFESETSKTTKKNISNAPGAFIGKSGHLYIRVRRVQPSEGNLYTHQTAVYSSVEAYNTRSSRPEYKQLSEVTEDYQTPVTIDLETLTIQANDIQ